MLRTVNERAMSVARGVGRLLPTDAKRFLFRMRPAAVTWDLRDHGLVFVQIPKVATTSMRAALAAHVFGDSRVDPDAIEERDTWVGDRYELNAFPAEIRKLSRERFSFAFVRNPLERLHSAFVNKVAEPVEPVPLFERHGISTDMTFPEFVRRLVKLPENRVDLHLRSQHRSITDRKGVVVDFVGRFERLADDWETLCERFGLPELPLRNVSSRGRYEDAYTPELARLVAHRYRRDVELFGYGEQIAEFT